MRKIIASLLVVLSMSFLTACSNDSNEQKEKETTAGKSLEADYEYSEYFDTNIFWTKIMHDASAHMIPEDEPVGATIELLDQWVYEYYMLPDKYYAFELREASGVDYKKVYNDYVKKLGVKTEFDGMTDDEVYKVLEQREIEQKESEEKTLIDYTPEGEDVEWGSKYVPDGGFRCYIYITHEEMLALKPHEGMELFLQLAGRPEKFEVTKESIAACKMERVYVSYMGEEGETYKKLTKEEALDLLKDGEVLYWDWKTYDKKHWSEYHKEQ